MNRFITFLIQLGLSILDLIIMAAAFWPTDRFRREFFENMNSDRITRDNYIVFLVISNVIGILIYSAIDLYFTLVVRRNRNLLRKVIKK